MKRLLWRVWGADAWLPIYLSVLALIFASEFAVMILLPVLTPAGLSGWLTALIDAFLLTLILVPLLWLVVIRPLRGLAISKARLLKQLVASQEDERRRIAHDLHDQIGQSLTSLLFQLRVFADASDLAAEKDHVARIRATVNDISRDVRRLAKGLRPAALDHLSLGDVIQRHVEEFAPLHEMDVVVKVEGLGEERLGDPVETTVFRIVQEALTNIARHAMARRVVVDLRRERGQLMLDIEDDGVGFDLDRLPRGPAAARGLGLSGMKERVELVEGEFRLQSRLGGGTRIAVQIPCQAAPVQ